jgi:hypothetical protein
MPVAVAAVFILAGLAVDQAAVEAVETELFLVLLEIPEQLILEAVLAVPEVVSQEQMADLVL